MRLHAQICLGWMLIPVLGGCQCQEAPTAWETFEGENGLMGFRNSRGEIVIAAQFIHADPFDEEGLASVRRERGWTWIDRNGKALVAEALTYDIGPDPFVEGLARFVEHDRVGFFDRTGRVVIPARYDYAYAMHQGLAVFCTGCKRQYHGEHYRMVDGRWGMVDRAGLEIVAANYDEILPAGEAGYTAARDGRKLRLDSRGQELPQ